MPVEEVLALTLVRVEDSRADCRANRTASLIRLPEAMGNGVEAVRFEARDICVAENMPVDMAPPSKVWRPRRILMHDMKEEDAHYMCICEALVNKMKNRLRDHSFLLVDGFMQKNNLLKIFFYIAQRFISFSIKRPITDNRTEKVC